MRQQLGVFAVNAQFDIMYSIACEIYFIHCLRDKFMCWEGLKRVCISGCNH